MRSKPHKMALTEKECQLLSAYRLEEILWKVGRDNRMQIFCSKEEFTYINSIRKNQPIVRDVKGANVLVPSVITELLKRYSPRELDAIAKGAQDSSLPFETSVNFEGAKFRFGIMSDLHLGSKYTSEERVLHSFKVIREWGAELILMPGDITEGMSSRQGHIYELAHLGYMAQKEYSIKMLSEAGLPIKAISGNHDDWFKKSNGAVIVKDIAQEVKGMEFLGEGFAKLFFNEAEVHLHHGLDGAAYAASYRVQKIVEAYEAGTKPQMLITGHDHKAGYFFPRDVHCILAGCIQNQTPFMQQKRLEAQKGFWLIEIEVVGKRIVDLTAKFKPFYK